MQHYLGGDAWSPDGTKLAYAANARTPTDMEVWIRDARLGRDALGLRRGHVRLPGRAGRRTARSSSRSTSGNNSDTSLHLVDVESGDTRELTPHDDDALFFPGPWAGDGSGFYLVTDEGSEFRGLAFYDLEAGRYEWVDGEPEADVDDVTGSADHGYLAWLVNEDGWDRLRRPRPRDREATCRSRTSRGVRART